MTKNLYLDDGATLLEVALEVEVYLSKVVAREDTSGVNVYRLYRRLNKARQDATPKVTLDDKNGDGYPEGALL